MIDIKVGDTLRVVQEFTAKVKSDTLDVRVKFLEGQSFRVDAAQGHVFTTNMDVRMPLGVVRAAVTMGPGLIIDGKLERLHPIEEGPEPPDPEPPEPEEPPTATYRLTYVALKKGRNRPGTNMLQMAATKLGELKSKPEWSLTADGVFGTGTENVVKSIQEFYGLTADGVAGTKTWHAMTPDLGSWRAPLYLRIAECQCTFESGTKGYGYFGAIYYEGWFNYGIWNCNRWSAKKVLELGGAGHMTAKVDAADAKYMEYKNAWEAAQDIEDEAQKEAAEAAAREIKAEAFEMASEVGAWYGSSVGRETQIGSYLLTYTVKPSIKNLVRAGYAIENFGIESLDDLQTVEDIPVYLAPFYERLLTQSCDITVNSGPGGFFPHKSPRAWDAKESGDHTWPAERLPFKEPAKTIYSEEFGQPIPDDFTYVTSDSSEPYAESLRRIHAELCQSDEQQIEVTAELQARCIIEQWRNMVIERRRCVARKDGHSFQGTYYNIGEQFGLGV
jgi:hypothetical protein